MDVSIVFEKRHQEPEICDDYLASPWYKDVIYVLKNLQAPPELTKTKSISIRLKSSRYYIINGYLYWKDSGGHLFWKTTTYKILRGGFYWPTLFHDIYKEVSTCHECQLFEGKRKLKPLPLVPILAEAPF